ncbi:oxidoreductase [Iamia majanohamensis]|uniref:Oxidoreductase n=1 Tax=Iamia majanohamensis TaxID=467976 RepID=A0AAF0BSE4_9ACTN|nr:oxidoreductase [Iamia majanohamensis]WCO68166.1 oxidoreductase [Iamia majanohamensis]
MAWTAADIPDQTGRTAVVTGANGGLGLETAQALAGAGAHVVMAVRDAAKADAAEARIRARHPGASLARVALDLGDLGSVRAAADAVLADHDRIDLLVNNAGLMAMPQQQTADGFELQLGVDHLGHWALTAHLLPALLRAEGSRVVTVTSTARFMGRPLDPADPHLERRYGAWRSYARAKMANFHFGLGLHRELGRAGAGTASLIAHPGLSDTDLQATTVTAGGGGWMGAASHRVAALTGMSPEAGARPQLRAATDPGARSGELYVPLFASNGPAVRRPVLRRFDLDRRIDELWAVSARETGVALDATAALGR